MRLFRLLVFGAVLALAASAAARAQEIHVSAAASLTNVVDALAAAWQAKGGAKVVANYAGSSALARQIEAGAPADVFISADLKWMDYVAEHKLIDPATRRNVVSNSLVLIAPADSKVSLTLDKTTKLVAALGDKGRLAIADPEAVPAGRYGKAALTSLGLWDLVSSHLAPAANVRVALALVAHGEAPLGIVYSTDAKAEPRVRIVATFPAGSYPPVIYPAAVVVQAAQPAQGLAFLNFLGTKEALTIFDKYGFVTAP